MKKDYKDFFGGLLINIIGIWVFIYSIIYLDLGTPSSMGSGMFPMGLGLVLAFFGLLMAVPALFRPGVAPEVRIWTPLFVLLGTGGFALTIRPFGLIPAVLTVVVISSLAELKVRPVSLALLCAALSLIAWLVFRVGLGMPVPMFRWPF